MPSDSPRWLKTFYVTMGVICSILLLTAATIAGAALWGQYSTHDLEPMTFVLGPGQVRDIYTGRPNEELHIEVSSTLPVKFWFHPDGDEREMLAAPCFNFNTIHSVEHCVIPAGARMTFTIRDQRTTTDQAVAGGAAGAFGIKGPMERMFQQNTISVKGTFRLR